MAPMITSALFLLATTAHAKPLGWFTAGADGVVLEGPVDVPLYRGPSTDFLPAVAVALPVPEQQALRHVLARVDLARGWNRVDPETASTLGVEPEWTRTRGQWRRIAELPRLEIGDLVLEGVHLEVTDEATGLILGMAALDQLAVALLPSEGVVRFVSASDGKALLDEVGSRVDASRQPTSSWTVGDTKHQGNGLTLRVDAAIRWGEAEVAGLVHLATASPATLVAIADRLPPPVQRAGAPSHDITPTLGDAPLDPTWALASEAATDPDERYLGTLGYDVLYELDLAVSPRHGQIALAPAAPPTWADAREPALRFARERYEQEEERRPTEEIVEGRVQIGFDGPKRRDVPLGDPGDPVIRDRNLDLAETLWEAGALEDALPHYLAASQHAGDHCLTHLRLGQRRLAWSGTRQAQSFVVDLVEQPLERAGRIWNLWLDLDHDVRVQIWRGQDQPEGSLQVYQPEACADAWGTLAAAARAQGRDQRARDIEARYQASDLSVAYARALRYLADGEPGTAEGLLRWVLGHEPSMDLDTRVALALAVAGRQDRAEVRELARQVPGYDSDHPLTAAMAIVEAGQAAGIDDGAASELLATDPRWMPGAVALALATDGVPPPWPAELDQRRPGSARVASLRAAHLAASGEIDQAQALLAEWKARGEPDWWTAQAIVAARAGDDDARIDALTERALRFPLLPGLTTGTGPLPTADDAGADAP